jgi:hypothetical protein
MTRRRLGRMPWWGWALIGWGAASAAAAVVVGRMIRRRDVVERPVGLADLADAQARTLDRLVIPPTDERPPPPIHTLPSRYRPAYPDLADTEPSLAGAILTLAYAADEDTARYWLAMCARRGATWEQQQELWATWQREHRPTVIYLDNYATEGTPDDDR